MGKYNKEKKREYYLKNKKSILEKTKNRYNSEVKKIYNKKYRELNKEELKIKDKEKHIRRKNLIRDSRLKKSFGISIDEYQNMFNNQKGLCKICGNPEKARQPNSEAFRLLCVDHCHSTGKVRGLLCTNCNIMLGQAKDDIQILSNAIEYLKQYGR